jgi:hypothetical protein
LCHAQDRRGSTNLVSSTRCGGFGIEVSCIAQYGVRMTTVDRAASQGWVADDSTFGARLALIRQRMHWGNVKEAAVACGLPVESWRSWERDGRVPQRIVEVAGIIADRSGCNYEWLLSGPSRSTHRSGEMRGGLTGRYPFPAVRTMAGGRPADNRPNGRALAAASTGPGRTAYVERRRRD